MKSRRRRRVRALAVAQLFDGWGQEVEVRQSCPWRGCACSPASRPPTSRNRCRGRDEARRKYWLPFPLPECCGPRGRATNSSRSPCDAEDGFVSFLPDAAFRGGNRFATRLARRRRRESGPVPTRFLRRWRAPQARPARAATHRGCGRFILSLPPRGVRAAMCVRGAQGRRLEITHARGQRGGRRPERTRGRNAQPAERG